MCGNGTPRLPAVQTDRRIARLRGVRSGRCGVRSRCHEQTRPRPAAPLPQVQLPILTTRTDRARRGCMVELPAERPEQAPRRRGDRKLAPRPRPQLPRRVGQALSATAQRRPRQHRPASYTGPRSDWTVWRLAARNHRRRRPTRPARRRRGERSPLTASPGTGRPRGRRHRASAGSRRPARATARDHWRAQRRRAQTGTPKRRHLGPPRFDNMTCWSVRPKTVRPVQVLSPSRRRDADWTPPHSAKTALPRRTPRMGPGVRCYPEFLCPSGSGVVSSEVLRCRLSAPATCGFPPRRRRPLPGRALIPSQRRSPPLMLAAFKATAHLPTTFSFAATLRYRSSTASAACEPISDRPANAQNALVAHGHCRQMIAMTPAAPGRARMCRQRDPLAAGRPVGRSETSWHRERKGHSLN